MRKKRPKTNAPKRKALGTSKQRHNTRRAAWNPEAVIHQGVALTNRRDQLQEGYEWGSA